MAERKRGKEKEERGKKEEISQYDSMRNRLTRGPMMVDDEIRRAFKYEHGRQIGAEDYMKAASMYAEGAQKDFEMAEKEKDSKEKVELTLKAAVGYKEAGMRAIFADDPESAAALYAEAAKTYGIVISYLGKEGNKKTKDYLTTEGKLAMGQAEISAREAEERKKNNQGGLARKVATGAALTCMLLGGFFISNGIQGYAIADSGSFGNSTSFFGVALFLVGIVGSIVFAWKKR